MNIKNSLILVSGCLACFLCGILAADRNSYVFAPYPQKKPIIIELKDDCYAGSDFKHEILSAKNTQKLLNQLEKRKLK